MTPQDEQPIDGESENVVARVERMDGRLLSLTRIVQDLADKVGELADGVNDVHEMVSSHHNGYDSQYSPDESDE